MDLLGSRGVGHRHPKTSAQLSVDLSGYIGITRYEVWKLPRPHNDTSPGFVSVAVVEDWPPTDDVFDRIDDTIRRWEDYVDE
jgi:hypothetical protein